MRKRREIFAPHNKGAAIAFFFGGAKTEIEIGDEFGREKGVLSFDFLEAVNIGSEFGNDLNKIFRSDGAEAVDVPTDEFEGW